MKIILLLILAVAGYSQTLSLTGPTSARPGGTVPIVLTLTNSAAQQVVGIQWSILYPAGGYSATVTPGAILTTASKGTQCTTDNSFCLVVGQNVTLINNGAVANYALKVPANAAGGTVTVSLSGILAVYPTGLNAPINTAASFTFAISPAQDINGDGVVNTADFTAMLAQVLGANSVPPVPCVADPNGDGRCDIFDLINIVIKIANP